MPRLAAASVGLWRAVKRWKLGARRQHAFGLPEPETSPRVFSRVEPYPGRFMHHVLIRDVAELDAECLDWLRRAWTFGGR